jgi:salicylate hydroxylase
MHNPISPSFKVLDVAVVGAGLGGLCAALSLRRAGHQVTLYERSDFTGEVGAGVATAPNGTRWLEVWGVDIAAAKPSFLKKLTIHDWESGEVKKVVQMGDSKAKFGYVRANF